MTLFAPLFLAGLLAIGVPIWVHLSHKERKEPLAFPSVMFLRRVPFRSAKRQRIRHWLLFMMRVLGIALIALAFTRPRIDKSAAAARKSGRAIVLLIDRSYSMSATGVWERAVAQAHKEIGKAQSNDRLAIIAFDRQPAIIKRFEDRNGIATAAIDRLKPGSEVTRYAPALRLAASQLNGPGEIVWITDAQQNGWRGTAELPEGVTTRVIDVGSPHVNNLVVSNVRVAPPRATITSDGERATVSVQLRLGGRIQQVRSVTVPANGTAEVAFNEIPATDAAGEIRIDASDDVAADNVVYFVPSSASDARVRVLGSDAFYVQRAVNASGVQGDVVILNGDARLPQARQFVERGGGLVIVGARSVPDFAPVNDTRGVEREATLVASDARHPFFSGFENVFEGAHVKRYMRAQPADSANILVRTDNGDPILIEKRVGKGRVLYFGAPLDRSAGDFVLQPGFVAFVQQLVDYAAAPGKQTRSYTVGEVIEADGKTMQITQPGVQKTNELIVANVDKKESDATKAQPAQFTSAVTYRSQVAHSSIASEYRSHITEFWWPILLTAFVLLIAETLIANRTARSLS